MHKPEFEPELKKLNNKGLNLVRRMEKGWKEYLILKNDFNSDPVNPKSLQNYFHARDNLTLILDQKIDLDKTIHEKFPRVRIYDLSLERKVKAEINTNYGLNILN